MTDLATMSYGDLVAALRKDLLLDASTDILPGSLGVALKADSTGWINAVGQNSWHSGGTLVQYRKDAIGLVYLRGELTGGVSASVAFTLPAGFRPGVTDIWPVLQSNGTAGSYLRVGSDGTVIPSYTVGAAVIYLPGTAPFLAEN